MSPFADSASKQSGGRGSTSSGRAAEACRQALTAYQFGHLHEAMRVLTAAIEQDAAAWHPRHLAGVVALSGGDFALARTHFRSAVRLASSPEDEAASWTGLGRLESFSSGPSNALNCFQHAGQLAPAFAPALAGQAAAWCDLGDYAQAESCARAALTLDDDARTRLVLARSLLFQSRMDESEALLRGLTTLAETSFMARFHLAAIALSRGYAQEAERGFRAVLEEQPRYPAYIELAKAKKFASVDDADLKNMERLLAATAPDADRMTLLLRRDLSFALAKACDDLELSDRAFPLLREANALRAVEDPFDFPAFERQIEKLIALTRRIAEGASANPDEGNGAVPLLLAALPRSGSSLLEQMLGGHSAIRPGGEFSQILPFLERAASEVSKPGSGAGEMAGVEAARQQIKGVLSREEAGVRFVTEKSPVGFMYAGLLARLFPRVKIVHLQRHPLDLVLSQYMQSFAGGLGWSYDLDTIVDYYLVYERVMTQWKDWLGTNITELRYEALVRDPERQLRRILGFCGLEYEPACLRFEGRKRPVWTASGFQVRQALHGQSVGKWLRYAKYLEPVKKRLHGSIVAYEAALNRETPASASEERDAV